MREQVRRCSAAIYCAHLARLHRCSSDADVPAPQVPLASDHDHRATDATFYRIGLLDREWMALSHVSSVHTISPHTMSVISSGVQRCSLPPNPDLRYVVCIKSAERTCAVEAGLVKRNQEPFSEEEILWLCEVLSLRSIPKSSAHPLPARSPPAARNVQFQNGTRKSANISLAVRHASSATCNSWLALGAPQTRERKRL